MFVDPDKIETTFIKVFLIEFIVLGAACAYLGYAK